MNPIQFEEQTQSLYRLRSARNKRRRLIEARDRGIRILDEAHTEAYYAFHKRPWAELEEPYQRGWYRHFELTASTARHRQAAMYADILSFINTVQQSPRRDFSKKTRRQGRKLRLGTEQQLSGMSAAEWKQSGLGATEKALFEWQPGLDRYGRFCYQMVFTQPWRYELKVRPRMITQIQQVDPNLQSRLQEMNNRFERHHLTPRRNKIIHGYAHRGWFRGYSTPERREGRRFRSIPLHRLIAGTE